MSAWMPLQRGKCHANTNAADTFSGLYKSLMIYSEEKCLVAIHTVFLLFQLFTFSILFFWWFLGSFSETTIVESRKHCLCHQPFPTMRIRALLLLLSSISSIVVASPLDSSLPLFRRNGAVPQAIGGSVAMSPNGTGTYPRSTNIMGGGVMIGAYTLLTGAPDNESILKSVKSTDGGQSWKPLGEVVGYQD